MKINSKNDLINNYYLILVLNNFLKTKSQTDDVEMKIVNFGNKMLNFWKMLKCLIERE